jgi:trehalose 6-phosphate synthase/phosphatase
VEKRLREEEGCLPIYLGKEEAGLFYEGFANSSVWPMLHSMTWFMRYEGGWWEAYRDVNRRFAEKVLEVAEEGDVVWVHDYQLMLVPEMLKRERPGLRVGFFLHTPFPSYEVFRCHPKRRALLEGLLGADLVGFHTFGYLRHFRSAVLRILGLESEFMHVRHGAHTTCLGVYPIGINAGKFEEELGTERHAAEKKRIRESNPGQKIVLSVERLDYTKGIPRRLAAIRLFLEKCADRDGIKFIFVSVPSRGGVEQYRELRANVESRIGRMNGRFATVHNSPIHFIHGSVEFHELCALYAAADVALVTPLVDGMNLVAKEYVAAKREETGVLLLSEFAGAAQEMFGAVQVNPYDPPAMAEAIRGALGMPEEEKKRRMGAMREVVMKFDAEAWARSFVGDLREIHCGGGESREAEAAGKELREVLMAKGKKMAIFVDYDGTLRELEREPMAACPTEELMALLGKLKQKEDVEVTIISGRKAEDLEGWLGECGFGLVAEHGAIVRRAGSKVWERLDLNVSYGWKGEITHVLRGYERSTPGSFVEEKQTGVVWHYRKSDMQFGEWKAKQLVEELTAVTANQPLEVRHGKKIVEVASTLVNKGAAAIRLMEGKHYDLVVTAGDDLTDESMFRMNVENLVSIKVGEGATSARYRVRGPGELRELLASVVGDSGSQTDMGPGVRLSQA